MTVSLFQWCAVIGILNGPSSAMFYRLCNLIKKFFSCFEILLLLILLTLIYIYSFLQCHGDIKLNLGPKKLKINSFSICHWNFISLAAYTFSL